MNKTVLRLNCFLLLISILSSCKQPQIPFKPHVEFTPKAESIKAGPSPFPLITTAENIADEQRIGETFGQRRDFYRAITAFERGEILLRGSSLQTILQFQYEILLSYYLAGKYEEAFCYFEKSALKNAVTNTFPAWKDMLIIVYDSSCRTGREEYAQALLKGIYLQNPSLANKLELYSALRTGDFKSALTMKAAPSYLKKIYSCYCLDSKSVNQARMMNALLPGAGYMYVKQVNTGITALIMNAVFIGATYQFAKKNLIFPAIICASLEVGWYIGGIWGAGRAAAEYNECLYENVGNKILEQERLYPLLMLDYVF